MLHIRANETRPYLKILDLIQFFGIRQTERSSNGGAGVCRWFDRQTTFSASNSNFSYLPRLNVSSRMKMKYNLPDLAYNHRRSQALRFGARVTMFRVAPIAKFIIARK
jgi:hypothetical protein